jgi:hypothetical protein
VSRICYIEKNFRGEALDIIQKANAICTSYQAQGFDLTLRQLYYQFVSRGWIDNKQSEYKRLGGVINDARLAGMLDWDFIVDRTRNMEQNSHWGSPADIIRSAARSFAIDKWAAQDTYVEVWIEKDALVGVLEGVCPDNDVPYFSCRGYTSQSEVWGAAQRLGAKVAEDKKVIIIHLGDHDPSGIDMSRDITDRLTMFIAHDVFGADYADALAEDRQYFWSEAVGEQLVIDRIALNMNQVLQYNPPPNPAKITDSRATEYIRRHGQNSWELDALDPATLTALIQDSIDSYKDPVVWQEAVDEEANQRQILTLASQRWADIVVPALNGAA